MVHWTTGMDLWTTGMDYWTTGLMDYWTTGMDYWNIGMDYGNMPVTSLKYQCQPYTCMYACTERLFNSCWSCIIIIVYYTVFVRECSADCDSYLTWQR